MKRRVLLALAAVVGLAALVVGVVWAFSVSGTDTNLTATTNCTPAITVSVGSVTGLVPGVKADVPVTVTDVGCAGVGATITSVTPTLTGVSGCSAGNYTVTSPVPPDVAVSDGGLAVIDISVTLADTAPDGCKGATASLQVDVDGTVP